MEPLSNNRHVFCNIHCELRFKCAEQHCNHRAERGFLTCADPAHRSLQEQYQAEGKALFQLKRRLEKLKISQPEDAMPESRPDTLQEALHSDDTIPTTPPAYLLDDPAVSFTGPHDGTEVESSFTCSGKTDGTIKNLKARFGRRRTHNEELCVTSCGMTLGRATFYVAEGLNGVRVRANTFLLVIRKLMYWYSSSGKNCFPPNGHFPTSCGMTTTVGCNRCSKLMVIVILRIVLFLLMFSTLRANIRNGTHFVGPSVTHTSGWTW